MSINDDMIEDMSGQTTLFDEMGLVPDLVKGMDNGIDIPGNYEIQRLKNQYDGEYFEGKPYLSEILAREFENKDTGKTETNYSVELVLINDNDEEALIIPIKLKTDENVQLKVHEASKLFALAAGLINLKSPGAMDNFNQFKKLNLELLKKQVDALDEMIVKIVEKETDNGIKYNSFKILKDYI